MLRGRWASLELYRLANRALEPGLGGESRRMRALAPGRQKKKQGSGTQVRVENMAQC